MTHAQRSINRVEPTQVEAAVPKRPRVPCVTFERGKGPLLTDLLARGVSVPAAPPWTHHTVIVTVEAPEGVRLAPGHEAWSGVVLVSEFGARSLLLVEESERGQRVSGTLWLVPGRSRGRRG